MEDTCGMLLSQRQTDVTVMFLSAACGAIVGVAAEAWWWAIVGAAGLAIAAYLLYIRAHQNDAKIGAQLRCRDPAKTLRELNRSSQKC